MAITGTAAYLLLVGRLLFGGTLAFMGLNHFMHPDMLSGYAESKGVPKPKLAVYASGAALALGGLTIITGIFAGLGALLIAAFFLVVTPMMHDFWAAPEEQQTEEMNNFLKNAALFGGAITFAALSTQGWGLAVGIGLF